jgi:hypothetical protein
VRYRRPLSDQIDTHRARLPSHLKRHLRSATIQWKWESWIAIRWAMFLGGIDHGLGSYQPYKNQPMNLWALSASFATILLAAINLLRTGRTGDRILAWISFAGCPRADPILIH